MEIKIKGGGGISIKALSIMIHGSGSTARMRSLVWGLGMYRGGGQSGEALQNLT